MRSIVAALAVLVVPPAAGSEPGQRLDCSDWVFLEPGLGCSVYTTNCDDPLSEGEDDRLCMWDLGANFYPPMDNESRFYRTTRTDTATGNNCASIKRFDLRRFDGVSEVIVAYIEERCVDPVQGGKDEAGVFRVIKFDEENGRMLVPVDTSCSLAPCQYEYDVAVHAITGFTTTFEILQSFTPSASAAGFRVPYMPEGMNGADYFDTFWGDLATLGNWSAAQGLECGYPSTAPSVGDYLEVADTLPPPGPNQGYYYVTAAHYQGETRYGRKTTNGRLSGRDPAVLPACTTTEGAR